MQSSAQSEIIEDLKDLIQHMAESLVDYPEDIRVEIRSEEVGLKFCIGSRPSDQGKLIGKAGRIANALRVIAKASAMRDQVKIYIEVKGDGGESAVEGGDMVENSALETV
jgi:predicted RNA-binding protein YlqC (UPF0109 family)